MKLALGCSIAVLAACASTRPTAAGGTSTGLRPPPESPLDKRVAEVAAAAPGIVATEDIGTTREGRPIKMLRLGKTDAPQPAGGANWGGSGSLITPDGRPALLIVAGLNAEHKVGTEVALGVSAALAAEHADLFDKYTVYILPAADPDGAVRIVNQKPRRETSRIPSPVDDDRDGRVDEDPPIDLDGDGYITLMRIKDPPAGFGLEATEMIDPDEPRLMRRPDRAKGERAVYAVTIEGKDQDGDGKIAEDGPDGTDLNMNFPYHWPEFRDGAGAYELCEPESLALATWIVHHSNLVAVLVFGPQDNLVKPPEGGRMDPTGRIPEGGGVEADDKPYFDAIGKVFRDLTGMTGAPTSDPSGALYAWTYDILGIYSFTTSVWVRPDLVKREEKKEDKKEEPKPADDKKDGDGAEQPGGAPPPPAGGAPGAGGGGGGGRRRGGGGGGGEGPGGGPPPGGVRPVDQPVGGAPGAGGGGRGGGGTPGGQPAGGGGGPGRFGGGRAGRGGGAGGGAPPAGAVSDAEDAKWLKYSDEKRNGEGFLPWKPFNHPQLGPVEIGGFVPGFKLNPPADDVPRLIEEQTKFVVELVKKLPRLDVQEPIVERLGQGVWRIRLRVVNEGFLPTRSALAVKARRLPPVLIEMKLPTESVIAGERRIRANTIPGSGGRWDAEWVVAAEDGSSVEVMVRSPEFGERKLIIPLVERPPVPKDEHAAPPEPPKPAPEGRDAGGAPKDPF